MQYVQWQQVFEQYWLTLPQAKKRRQARRDNAVRDHSKAMRKLQDEVHVSFDESSNRMYLSCALLILPWVDQRSRLRLHKLRIQNLSTLLERKAAIEENMLASTKKLEKAFVAANQELRVTFGERFNDIGG